MQRPQPFHRSLMMAQMFAAALALPAAAQASALEKIGVYESRGKGGKTPSRHVGTKAYARAASKARNVRRNRRARRS